MSHVFAPRESAFPADLEGLDALTDIIVVGGGGGGLPAALFSRWRGNDVIVLEKAEVTGGTARKAAFWYWIPNNEPMRAAGQIDAKDDFLRFVSRLSRPEQYNAEGVRLGLDEWSHDQFSAIYDSASIAAEELNSRGALRYRHVSGACDYWAELPEDKNPTGRVLIHEEASESMADGGLVSITTMTDTAIADGVDVRTGHRVQRVIRQGGHVVGVEATDAEGRVVRVGARKAVIFATGGFTHDDELRKNFLSLPLYPGCAAPSNEGDFVRIASTLGAQLRNMNYAWMCPVPLESSVNRRPELSGIFSLAGDSMILVSSEGKRVVNEKLQYNELAQEFFRWDTVQANYPHRVLVAVWDQQAQDNCASPDYGNPIVPLDRDRSNVIEGATLEELSSRVAERLAQYKAATGGLALSDDFTANLEATIARFNGFARTGVDEDFLRGTRAVQMQFNGPVAEDREAPNVTMREISASGPFYATLITGGTLDTKGGPKTNTNGQILDDEDAAIGGLYGVGNCVASASAGSYWAGGATLGPIIALAYRAAEAADAETARALDSAVVAG